MSDIVLISPPGTTAERLYSMCEVGGLSAVLKNEGYSVSVIDCAYYGSNINQIAALIWREKPLLIGIVFQWEHQPFWDWTKQLIKDLNKNKSQSHITAIGRGATVCYSGILNRYELFHSIIRGESEKTVIELFEKVMNKSDLFSQKGIAYKKNGQIVDNEPQVPIFNLDTLPLADRDYLRDRRFYPVAPMYTSRYCYGECNFCVNKINRNATPCKEYRARSAQLVSDEMKMINEKYGVKTFCFVDNNFFVDGERGKDRAVEIAEQLLKRNVNVRFHIESRVNDVEIELFSLLKRSGLRKVFLGIESGCQNVLDRYQKETTVAMNKKAIEILKRLKINWEPGFIMFDPLTTMSELKDNYHFIKETELHRCKSSTENKLFHPLTIYPGSSIIQQFPKEAIIDKSDENGAISYKILDDKVRVAMNGLMQYKQHISRISFTYMHFNQKLQNDYNVRMEGNKKEDGQFIKFQKQFVKWQDGLASLDMEVLGKVIDYLEQSDGMSNELVESIRKLVMNSMEEYHFTYFRKNCKEQIEELEKISMSLSYSLKTDINK